LCDLYAYLHGDHATNNAVVAADASQQHPGTELDSTSHQIPALAGSFLSIHEQGNAIADWHPELQHLDSVTGTTVYQTGDMYGVRNTSAAT
jgi:hypothetical protein